MVFARQGTYPHLNGVLHLGCPAVYSFAGRGTSVKHGLLSDCTGYVLVLALLLLCSLSWGACRTGGAGTTSAPQYTCQIPGCFGGCPQSNGEYCPQPCNGGPWVGDKVVCYSLQMGNWTLPEQGTWCTNHNGLNGFTATWRGSNCVRCDTQAEADSVYCERNPTAEQCISSDPSDCPTAECCMEFNQGNVPIDSGFVGCEPPEDGSSSCTVSGSSAVCNGVSVYSFCTQMYMWNKQLRKCAAVSTNNCTEVRRVDDMCTDVECNSFTETEVSGVTFNPSTKCYEGKFREYTHMECSNGVRGQVSAGPYQDYKVCESYLDSLGIHIGESTGTDTDVSISDYISGQYPGGTSVDGEGNEVQNSPGGQTGGTSTTQQEVVTKDSAGTTVVVKASDGSDSTQLVTTFNKVQCLGCSNGFCTLSNGSTSWSCPSLSCSAALMSYNMQGGQCSANYSDWSQQQGVPNNTFVGDTASKIALKDSVIDYTEQLNRINRNIEDFIDPSHFGDGATAGYFGALAAMLAVVENTSAAQLQQDSALHYDLKVTLEEFQSAVEVAMSAQAGTLQQAIGSASSQISGVVDNQNIVITSAASGVQSAVAQGAANIVTAIHGTTSAVNSNTAAIQSASSVLGVRIQENTSAISAGNVVLESVDSKVGAIVGQISQANSEREKFYGYMRDTLQTDLDITLRGALDYHSDNVIVPAIQTQTQAIVQALDTLRVDVQVDTVHVDSVSIRATTVLTQDAHVVYDTADFESLWQQGYSYGRDSVLIDSSGGSGIDTTNMYDGQWVEDTSVDSIEATLPAKFDSAAAKANVRSDSMTREYAEKLLRVSGIDSAGKELKELFGGYSQGCPRECLRINVQRVGVLPPVSIHLDTIVCDFHFAGGYTLIDFMKLVLRLLTSMFCVMMIWNLMVKLGGGKK